MQLYVMRRPDKFGVNSGYYLSGDGSWAGQMQPATADKDGGPGLVPPPLLGQNTSYLRGDGKWIQSANSPTAVIAFKTRISASFPDGTYYPTANKPLVFDAVDVNVGSGYNKTTGIFTTPVAGLYQFNASVTNSGNPNYLNYYIVKNGSGASQIYDNINNIICRKEIRGDINISSALTGISQLVVGDTVAVCCTPAGNAFKVNDSFSGVLISSNNSSIFPFGGATSSATGGVGYVPAPQAGDQTKFLCANGTWQHICPAFATYYSFAATGTNLRLTGANTKTLVSRGINIDATGTKITPTVAGYYECRASWNSGGVAVDSKINITVNGGAPVAYGTSQVGVYQSGVVEAIILLNGTTDYIQIYNDQWTFGQAQVNIKWFSS